MRKLKIILLGFGNAAKAFSKILCAKQNGIKTKFDCEVITTGIVTGSRGSLYNPEGIGLLKASGELDEKGSFDSNNRDFSKWTSMDFVEKADYDVIIEMTPLNIFTGQPATDYLKKAMLRGKHAITANKGPIAWYYSDLAELAREKNVRFYFETAVMDGTPVFNLMDETLKFCTVAKINGILNTTTNYILEEMAKEKDFNEIVEEGKRLGFVDTNPAMDIEGWDAVAKVAALMNVLMDAKITPMDIDRTGIENITVSDIKNAAEKGKVIKLLCEGHLEEGKAVASVKPSPVKQNNIMSTIDGTSSIIQITTDLMGKISVIEHNPEITQTGYGIFSDLIRVISNEKE